MKTETKVFFDEVLQMQRVIQSIYKIWRRQLGNRRIKMIIELEKLAEKYD